MDFYLQPLMKSIPSYFKDTGGTIRLLEQIDYREDYVLVTADVAALYTCIPHELGLAAVEYFLSQSDRVPIVQQRYIMELLQFATKHNYFWFNNQYFLQQKGVAMGAKFTPASLIFLCPCGRSMSSIP